nr:MAG TPA: hypothetical protein [Bacteriophage sp.]
MQRGRVFYNIMMYNDMRCMSRDYNVPCSYRVLGYLI